MHGRKGLHGGVRGRLRRAIVEVQCAVSRRACRAFAIVGLPDKAVSEAREQGPLGAQRSMAIALPSKRITVNLSPADHAQGGFAISTCQLRSSLLAAIDIVPQGGRRKYDGRAGGAVARRLPGAGDRGAARGDVPRRKRTARYFAPEELRGRGRMGRCGAKVIAPATPVSRTSCSTIPGQSPLLDAAAPGEVVLHEDRARDLRDVKGQERAKRALEIAAAGRHHLMMVGHTRARASPCWPPGCQASCRR